MNKYLKGLILAAMTLSSILTMSVQAENIQMPQELRADPWYLTTDNQHLDVVIELPGGTPPLVGENLKLRINGKDTAEASSVISFQQSGKELAWLVCIESASALSKPFIKTTQAALYPLSKDKIALFTIGRDFNQKLTFEENTNPAVLRHAIDSLKPAGKLKTRLYQSLLDALDYYEQAAKVVDFPKRKRILVIADGHDQDSSASYDNVVYKAKALGIPIDTISIKPPKKVNANPASLEVLAERTEGRFVSATAEIDLADALTNVHRLLTETQTVVASFKYQPDQKRMAEFAEVVLQLPSSTKLTASLNAKNLPAPKIEPVSSPTQSLPNPHKLEEHSPDSIANIGWWLTLGVFLLTGAVLFRSVRIRKLP